MGVRCMRVWTVVMWTVEMIDVVPYYLIHVMRDTNVEHLPSIRWWWQELSAWAAVDAVTSVGTAAVLRTCAAVVAVAIE